ncbi:hypothetical protein HDU83_007870 [Entophlyctis luteolus]|nr:hypothetical protein HDU83_007870 [Entophlyctis luteolus]
MPPANTDTDDEAEFPLLEPARIRIVLVPVLLPQSARTAHPSAEDVFRRLVDRIAPLAVVPVRDATPAEYRNYLSPENTIPTNIMTSGVIQVFRADYQMHTRTMGVIGLADESWSPSSTFLSETAEAFSEITKRYPSSLVNRCFVFDPSPESVTVANATFSASTGVYCVTDDTERQSPLVDSLVTSFASELLRAFGSLVKQIESRPVILGPTPPNYLAANVSGNAASRGQTNGLASSIAESINSGGAAAIASNAERNKKRTPGRALKLTTDLFLMAGRVDIALQSYQNCIELLKQNGDFLWWAAALESYQAAILIHLLNKAGIGPTDLRMSSENIARKSNSSLEIPTISSVLKSPLILKSLPLRTFLAEVSDRHRVILQIYERATVAARNAQQPNTNSGTNSGGSSVIPILPVLACIRVARVLRGMNRYTFSEYLVNGAGISLAPSALAVDDSVISGVEDLRRPGPALLQAASKTRPASGGARSATPSVVSQSQQGTDGSLLSTANTGDIVFNNGIGASKVDVGTWLIKAHMLLSQYPDFVSVSDRVSALGHIAAIYGSIGFRSPPEIGSTNRSGLPARISAMGMLDVGKREQLHSEEKGGPISVRGYSTSVSDNSLNSDGDLNDTVGKHTTGVIQCYKRVCEVFGLRIRSRNHVLNEAIIFFPKANRSQNLQSGFLMPSFSDDEEDWLDDFDNEIDLQTEATHEKDFSSKYTARSRIVKAPRLRFGWSALQIQVFKECIQAAEAVEDHPYTIYFIIRMLRRLGRRLSQADQQDAADHLEAVILKTVAKSAYIPRNKTRGEYNTRSLPVMVRGIAGGVAGIPVLRKIVVVPYESLPQRLTPVSHPKSRLENTPDKKVGVKDVFLHNPKTTKSQKNAVFVAGEVAYVDLVLANPFAFDLELKSIMLLTSGVEFQPKQASSVIPAFSRAHRVRVCGIPLSPGALKIHGVTVRMFGGCLEEEIFPVKKVLDDKSRKTKDGKRKKPDERELFGKHSLKSVEGIPHDRSWFVHADVFPKLPLIDVKKGAGIELGALMMYEGERSCFLLELENIGDVPVNHISVWFVEDISPSESNSSDAVERLEDIYERDVYEHNIRAFWLEGETDDSKSGRASSLFPRISPPKELRRIETMLNPKERLKVKIGVFGKRRCLGGTVVFEYGNITEDDGNATETYFIRQSVIPIILKVETPFDLHNISVFHINNRETTLAMKDREIARAISLEDMVVHQSGLNDLSFSSGTETDGRNLSSDHFLLSFDIHNILRLPFDISFDIYDDDEIGSLPVATISATIHPQTTKRIFLPIKRIYLPTELTLRPIPLPTWKQFVVGRSESLSLTDTRFRRRGFWLRECLVGLGVGRGPQIDAHTGEYLSDLVFGGSSGAAEDVGDNLVPGAYGRLVARWTCGRGRSGSILGIRSVELRDETMIDAVVQEEVSIATGPRLDASAISPLVDRTNSRYVVRAHEFITFQWTLTNNRYEPINVCFRVQPMFGSLELESDFSDKLASCESRVVYSGALETAVPGLLAARGGTATHAVSFMFLSRGVYTLVSHAEEVGPLGEGRARDGAQGLPKKKSKKDKDIDVVALGLVASAGTLFWCRDTVVVEIV